MGNSQSIRKVSFEDIQTATNFPADYLVINVLSLEEQGCLISGTILGTNEENIINANRYTNKNLKIIIYGKNSSDDKIVKKYQQLKYYGFYNVYVYPGGLFEWLLLQDIYGSEQFPTTSAELDILKFKPANMFGILMIGNGLD